MKTAPILMSCAVIARDTRSGRGIAGYDVVNESVADQERVQYLIISPLGRTGVWVRCSVTVYALDKLACLWALRHLRRMLQRLLIFSRHRSCLYNAGIEEASRQKTMASRTRGGVQRRRVGIAN